MQPTVMPELDRASILRVTSEIVAGYVGSNAVAPAEVAGLIRLIHGTLQNLAEPVAAPMNREPAVPVRRSILPDYLICLEDGKKLKMLKRYLRSRYNLSPEEYRRKWGLPANYPMVSPNYASHRSKLAKRIGLGNRKAE